MNPTVLAMLWALAAGLIFTALNALLRVLTRELDPFVVQFLRYGFGLVAMLPFILHAGLAAYRPRNLQGQFWRGAVHATGLFCWFAAAAHVPLAEMTALGFTTPLFIMLGAVLVFRERLVLARWVAALVGFAGVLIVVWPGLGQAESRYSLLMLAASPIFAASFLITKALTRQDRSEVIVAWQAIAVSLCTLPFALWFWSMPSGEQWALFAVAGVLGSAGHFCLTRAIGLAEVSAIQPIRFLELLWAAMAGFLIWGDRPGTSTLVGGAVIFAASTWIARRESRGR